MGTEAVGFTGRAEEPTRRVLGKIRLILGSASIDLLHRSGESLAGLIAYVDLPPLTALEIAAQRPALERSGGSVAFRAAEAFARPANRPRADFRGMGLATLKKAARRR
ncbi:MAG: hypothetical protein EA420_16955 [Candidatus Competibacteraceae bacterium]|nr:MAG: hypothetical protein EA420_16955 [Candidatus Competibacteraceae bacterium]